MNRPGFSRRRRMTIAAALLLGTALTAVPAHAQDGTWNGATNDFGSSSNWVPAAVPTNRATFANTGQTAVTITVDTTISEIEFAANAQPYVITNSGNLTINGGISNNSLFTDSLRNNGGTINFTGNAQVQGGATALIAITNLLGSVTFADQSGINSRTSLVTTAPGATATAGVTTIVSGTGSTSFLADSHADDAGFSTTGGGAGALGAGATATGGNAFLSFSGNSHADSATITVGNAAGSAAGNVPGAGGTATGTGGNATLTFSDNSHADETLFVNFSGPSSAIGGAGAAGTGAVGTAAVAQGGFGLTIFNDNSHADRATINNVGGATSVGGGAGGTGGISDGGAGGAATANAGAATFILNDNSHADGATITNRADLTNGVGGNGGAGGPGGAGGAGGNATATADATDFVLNDNAHVSDATIINRGGDARAIGGNGGAGGGTLAVSRGGAGGNGTSTGGDVAFTLNGNATLGIGTTIQNRGGNAIATGGNGGAASQDDGGRGGNGNATGGDAALVFNDHSSAGDAVITNQTGTAMSTGGIGGAGSAAFAGGNGGFGAAIGGRATIDFNGNATAASATITNLASPAGSSTAAGANGTGSTGGLGGGGSASTAFATIRFNDNATGGSAHIVNTVGNVFFNDNSIFGTAAPGATVALIDNAGGGNVFFNDSASLGNGGIVNNGAVTFADSSTAGTGTITNNAFLSFSGSSDAVAGRVVNGATGQVFVGVNGLRLGSLSGGGTVSLGANTLQAGYLDLADSFSGVISGAGALVKRGTGTLTLTGDNTYLGGTTIEAGTLQIGNGGTTGSIVGNIVDNANLTFNRSDTITFGGDVSGTGALTKVGAGTLVLTGTNTYSGTTTITAGTLQVGNGGTTGTLGTGNVVNNASLVFNRSNNLPVTGAISGTGSVTLIGTGTVRLVATNTYTGGTTISAGTLVVGNGGSMGSITGNVLNNSALVFNHGSTSTFAGDVTGSGTLEKQSIGTDIFTGTLAHTGGTTITNGTIQLGNGGTTGSLAGNVTLQNLNSNLAFNRSNAYLFGGAVSGAGSLTQSGTGQTVLTGANTYTGGTTVSAGVLRIGSGTNGSILGDVQNNAELWFGRSDNTTYGGVVSGTGSVTVLALGGTLTLTGNNTYTGGTTIISSTLQIGNGGTTGSIVGDVISNAGALVFNRSDTITWSGLLTGGGTLTQAGTGTLILTGNQPATGIITVSAGTLQIGNGGTTGSVISNIRDNANLTFNRSDTITYGGIVFGTGSLTKAGAGTLVLTGANTYTGATNVNAGTLELLGSITSNTIVGASGALRGTGTITGTLITNGLLTPGTAAAPLGTLTVSGNASFNAGSFFAPTITSAGASSLLQAGSLTINGGTVRPSAPTGGLFMIQTDYRIAVGTAGRTGQFTGVDESLLPGLLDASLVYTATETFLRIRRNASNFAQAPNLTPNQSSTSAALDAAVTGNNPLVFTTYASTYNTLLAMPASGALQGALNVLSGDALTAFPVAAQDQASRFAHRLDTYTWSNSSNVWGLIAYGDQDADGDGNAPGFGANGLEFQVGFNTSLGHDTRLGLSAGYNDGDVDVPDRLATGDIETWSVGAQLRHDFAQLYAAGQLTYSWHSIETARALLLAGTAAAAFDATSFTAGAELGWAVRSGQLSIEPHVTVRYASTDQDAYSEAGPVGSLDVAAADYQTTRLGLGVRLANRDPAAPVRFHALARYEHESGDSQSALDNALPGLPAYRVVGTDLGDDIFTGDVGVEFTVSNGLSVFVAGGGHVRSNETSLNANAGLRVVF